MEDFSTYQSPYSWRYGSAEMRRIWSEEHKRHLWRRLWLALAEVQGEFNLVSTQQIEDIRLNVERVNIPRALELEETLRHDVMAELQTFAEQCPVGGGILHLGMTSMDVVDNADALRVHASLEIVINRLGKVLTELGKMIESYADLPVIGFTHLQPAEPTTLGYRLAVYAQDWLEDFESLNDLQARLRIKGLNGAVGTRAAFMSLVGYERLERIEERFSERVGLPQFLITAQTYPRRQDYAITSVLAGMAATANKFAFDLRFLQSPPVGELAEPFRETQVGSSAMPFKRNPVQAEKIDSLARLLAQMPRVAWDNAALSLLERTLDDSANRRTSLPESFLITDELLLVLEKIISGMQVNEIAIRRNLNQYSPFAATEPLLMELVKVGVDRQRAHAAIRSLALHAWKEVQKGKENPMAELVAHEPEFLAAMGKNRLLELMKSGQQHIGDAPQRALRLVEVIQTRLNKYHVEKTHTQKRALTL